MSVIAVLALFLGGGLALCHSVVCFVFGSLDGFLACFRLFFFGEFNMVIDYHFTVYRLAYFNIGFIVVVYGLPEYFIVRLTTSQSIPFCLQLSSVSPTQPTSGVV